MTEDTQGVNPQAEHPPVSRNLIKNPISLIGVALAVVAFANIVFLVLIDLSGQPAIARTSACLPTWLRRDSWFWA